MTFSYGGYDEKSIGLLGFILYFIYLLVCSIRTFIIWRDEEDLEPKVVFHLVLSMNAGLECIYFVAMLINDRTGLVGYAAHMLALLTNVIAFSVVIYLWTSIISYKRDVSLSKYILGGFVLLNMGCTLAGVIDLCRIGNYEKYLAHSKAYETIVIVNALSLFILCIGMLVYGMVLKARLDLSLHDLLLRGSHAIVENTKKIQLLRRILIILGICTSCFLLRVVCLGVLLFDVTTHHQLTDQIPLVVWYTLSQWIPNFGAGYTLLYIMRTRLEVKARISHQTPTARQFQQSISGSFYPSSFRENDEENSTIRIESKVSGISPIFIGTNDCDISNDGSGASGIVRDSIGNPIQLRNDDWSGDWIEGTERCFPSDES